MHLRNFMKALLSKPNKAGPPLSVSELTEMIDILCRLHLSPLVTEQCHKFLILALEQLLIFYQVHEHNASMKKQYFDEKMILIKGSVYPSGGHIAH